MWHHYCFESLYVYDFFVSLAWNRKFTGKWQPRQIPTIIYDVFKPWFYQEWLLFKRISLELTVVELNKEAYDSLKWHHITLNLTSTKHLRVYTLCGPTVWFYQVKKLKTNSSIETLVLDCIILCQYWLSLCKYEVFAHCLFVIDVIESLKSNLHCQWQLLILE